MTTWVRVQAPVRVLDAGGWTDTWFAGGGTVCQLAVEPGSEVSVRRRTPTGSRPAGTADLHLPAFGEHYRFRLDQPPSRHPLLETALRRWARPEWQLEVTVAASVPPGSGLGTSASVVVALLAALHGLAGEAPDRARLARCAHEVETVDLGLQSGVQDQIASAYGGSNLIRIDPYPHPTVQPLLLAPAIWDGLGRRVLTVYLGSPHRSSAVHDAVIARLRGADRETFLAPLRTAGEKAAAALVAGDLEAYGRAMIDNTEAQARLHPALVSRAAQEVIEVARSHGAAGWKVNGAGGDGGTVSIVGPADPAGLTRAVAGMAGPTVLPLLPARFGVRIVDQG